jgi:hypothetical protein
LKGAWSEIDRGLASVIMLLQGQASKEGSREGALAELLVTAVSALDVAREDIAMEVSELRQQRQAEERLISLLSRQREDLRADVAQTQSALVDVSSELQAARRALQSTEEDQARHREETLRTVVSGVESLLRGGMDSIGRSLKDHSDTVRSHIGEAVERSAASSALAAGAEERAAAIGGEASEVAKSWAAGTDAACDRIATAQVASLHAGRQVYTAATENVAEVVAIVDKLQVVQDTVQPKWNASRDNAAAAAASWNQQDRAAIQSLGEVASKSSFALQRSNDLRQEVAAQCLEAEKHISERAQEDHHHSSLLSGLGQLHAECSQEEEAADAHHLGVLSALGEGALAIADSTARRGPEADCVLQAVRSHMTTAAGTAEAHSAALVATGVAIAEMAPQVEAAHECVAENIAQWKASGVESYREAASSAREVAQQVKAALKSTTSTLGAHRTAADVTNAARERRWLKLERSHGDVLQSLVTEATSVATQSDSAASESKAKVRKEEERAEAAQREAAAKLEEHRRQLGAALAKQKDLWHSGLAEKPMQAFVDDAIFEDQLSCDIPAAAAPLPPRILGELSTERPNVEALAAEFQASIGKNPNRCNKEDVAPMRVETPVRRGSSVKAIVKSFDEACVLPRRTLGELQVYSDRACE